VAAGEGELHWCERLVAFTVADSPAMSEDYSAVYGDSLQRGKVSRHVARLDNGELR
jgi:hypothetical protein